MNISILDANTLGGDIDLSVISLLGETEIYAATPPDMTAERIKDAEVVVLNKVKLSRQELEGAEKLKLICVAATGYDNIDVEYCKSRGIAVCNVCGYSTNSVAQLTVSIVLSLVMHMGEFEEYVKSGEYTKSGVQNRLEPVFHELAGMTWGIAGYGNIGKKVASVAQALGCNVIAYKRTPDNNVECVSLDELCRGSDIITIHLPLTEQTRGILGAEQIGLMKENVLVVNAARGAVIDEKAFAEALAEGRIGAFGTDVYSSEPMGIDSPFQKILKHPRAVFTPHMAWGAYESRKRCMEEIRENILAFFAGKIRNRVDL